MRLPKQTHTHTHTHTQTHTHTHAGSDTRSSCTGQQGDHYRSDPFRELVLFFPPQKNTWLPSQTTGSYHVFTSTFPLHLSARIEQAKSAPSAQHVCCPDVSLIYWILHFLSGINSFFSSVPYSLMLDSFD